MRPQLAVLSDVSSDSRDVPKRAVIGETNMPLPAKTPGEMTTWDKKAVKGRCGRTRVAGRKVIDSVSR
ncbi:hypothetical protein CEPID_12350 [Corynebacterium epidermidicanis]|uniref:Uncharacterized protein n=1 Tax=Corynebacterium epidermidicanis TaxID=1050174 RepID=A0A0G3GZN7_9CORY|nr:hypothetical protein CEPID_12350 [Corynebacterium epidermidicanis]